MHRHERSNHRIRTITSIETFAGKSSILSKNIAPFARRCVTRFIAPSFSANLQTRRIVKTASCCYKIRDSLRKNTSMTRRVYRAYRLFFAWNEYPWKRIDLDEVLIFFLFFFFSVQKCGWSCWRSWWFCWCQDRARPGPREPVRIEVSSPICSICSIKLGIFYRGKMERKRRILPGWG